MKLHDQYGPVVRYTPKDVSFITADAYKTIYGHKTGGAKTFEKDLRVYRQNRPAPNLIISNHDDHKRQRKLLSHAFSQKALRSQESLLNHYVDLFIERLTQKAREGTSVDMVAWYNFATFDLIGHLALGQPFGCLESGRYHPWISKIFSSIKAISFSQALIRLGLRNWIPTFTPAHLRKATQEHYQFTEHAAGARLDAKDTNSQDFMSYILRYNDERGMSRPEILENSSLLIIAGSETTATLLSGATYHLLKNREKHDKLVKEIRSTFAAEEEITAGRVDQLKYLLAVLSEAFRMCTSYLSTQLFLRHASMYIFETCS
jgi:cytochrome P450